jgi:hypothetical protein
MLTDEMLKKLGWTDELIQAVRMFNETPDASDIAVFHREDGLVQSTDIMADTQRSIHGTTRL